MKRIPLLLICLCICMSVFAQVPGLPTPSTPQIDKSKISKVLRGIPRHHAISTEFLAPLFRHFTFGHEMEIKKDISLESKVGVIFGGPVSSNPDQNYKQYGGFVRTGVKFYRDFPQRNFLFWGERERGERGTFEGRYIKPELVLGYFSEESTTTATSAYSPQGSYIPAPSIPTTQRKGTFAAAVLVNFGRQYLYGKRLLVGYEWGVGYAFSNEDMTQIRNGNIYRPYGWYYSHIGAPNSDFPVAFSIGFNVGLLLGK